MDIIDRMIIGLVCICNAIESFTAIVPYNIEKTVVKKKYGFRNTPCGRCMMF